MMMGLFLRSPPGPPPAPPLPSEGPPVKAKGRRLRRFHWEPIPAERVLGRRNLWTAESGSSRRGGGPLSLDLALLEALFGQPAAEGPAALGGAGAAGGQQVSLLEAKKVLNLGIFLKQFKRPAGEIVADLQAGEGASYGAEKLLELKKMLPDAEEGPKVAHGGTTGDGCSGVGLFLVLLTVSSVSTLAGRSSVPMAGRLEAFQGDQSRLSEPEIFALLLVQVPSYARRLELLVLKEEFFPQLNSLRSAIQILTEAALELLDCEELHDLIRLVLEAGNYMNEGGYAGCALGFRVPSLLRLADTKACRPGMDLLHFVALEAERKDPSLLHFPRKLQHVGPASRIVDTELLVELRNLGERLQGARGELRTLGWESQMGPFLEVAKAELGAARTSWEGLCQATATLADFLCEEPQSFRLPDTCGVFQTFAESFLAAVQENRAQEAAARRQRERQEKHKRRSIATCSMRDPGLEDVELDALFHRDPFCSGQRGRTLRGPHRIKSPPARERTPPQPLSRRHTLAVLHSPHPEDAPSHLPFQIETIPRAPILTEAALNTPLQAGATPDLLPLATPSHGGKKARLFGEGLVTSILESPPATSVPLTTPLPPSEVSMSPGGPVKFRLSSLFSSKKTLPERTEYPISTQASPKDTSALVGFFCRLSLGEKSRRPSQS
ncbi:FH2 domain-containing protein 1-like isoform X2 [Sceloporus undulatus]|uniref:FH2 domain-containing protein 1-like isoform X2 n=1 Tax=Sceloporus undulatus TaxID=8520 RepID=UPI001C4AB5D4|nr:FH2 domain-containing protein 1-like isoform X2 [Sceloporus undulatus]